MTRTYRPARRPFYTTLAALPLLAALASAPEGARAQWATSGDNINNTNTGNVGVGTAAPDQKLAVEGMFGLYPTTWTGPTRRGLFIFHGGLGGAIYAFNHPAGTGDPIDLSASSFNFHTYVGGNSYPRLTLTNGGNLGLGTTAPDKLFTVQGQVPATGATMAVVRTTGDNHGNGLGLDATGEGNNNFGFLRAGVPKASLSWDNRRNFLGFVNLAYSGADFGLRLNVDGSLTYHDGAAPLAPERFRVTAAGNVGVGTASPGSRLFVGPGAPAVATLPGVNVALGGNSYISASNGAVNTFIGADTSTYGIVGTLSNHPLGLRANNTVALTVHPNGNVRIGATAAAPPERLHVEGDLNATGTIRGGNIEARYQDLAEWVPSRQQLSAGTVVVLDTTLSNHVVASTAAYDTGVAGVVSGQPGIILGEGGVGKVMVATTGRVRVRVDATRAPVRIGDLLVTGDTAGVAMRSEPLMAGGRKLHAPGTIVGKALEPLEGGVGEILVLLSLQ